MNKGVLMWPLPWPLPLSPPPMNQGTDFLTSVLTFDPSFPLLVNKGGANRGFGGEQGPEVAVWGRTVLLHCLFHPQSLECHGVAVPMPGWVWCLYGKSWWFSSTQSLKYHEVFFPCLDEFDVFVVSYGDLLQHSVWNTMKFVPKSERFWCLCDKLRWFTLTQFLKYHEVCFHVWMSLMSLW